MNFQQRSKLHHAKIKLSELHAKYSKNTEYRKRDRSFNSHSDSSEEILLKDGIKMVPEVKERNFNKNLQSNLTVEIDRVSSNSDSLSSTNHEFKGMIQYSVTKSIISDSVLKKSESCSSLSECVVASELSNQLANVCFISSSDNETSSVKSTSNKSNIISQNSAALKPFKFDLNVSDVADECVNTNSNEISRTLSEKTQISQEDNTCTSNQRSMVTFSESSNSHTDKMSEENTQEALALESPSNNTNSVNNVKNVVTVNMTKNDIISEGNNIGMLCNISALKNPEKLNEKFCTTLENAGDTSEGKSINNYRLNTSPNKAYSKRNQREKVKTLDSSSSKELYNGCSPKQICTCCQLNNETIKTIKGTEESKQNIECKHEMNSKNVKIKKNQIKRLESLMLHKVYSRSKRSQLKYTHNRNIYQAEKETVETLTNKLIPFSLINDNFSREANTDICDDVIVYLLKNQIQMIKHFTESQNKMYLNCCQAIDMLNDKYR